MEELGTDDATVRLQEEEAEQERRRRRNKKKPSPLARQRTESEIRDDLGLNDVGATFRVLGVLLAVFGVMAGIGGVMSLISSSNNAALASQVQAQQKLNVNVAREVFVLACETTWQATKLWARLLVAVLLPTSHTTFRITKDGFSAMQPSLQASWLFAVHLHWTTKLALAGAAAAGSAAWLLQREIRRRRYLERLQAWQARRAASVTRGYDAVATRVRRQSRVLADLLPHALFAGAAAAGYAVGRQQFAEFSRGLGGWAVVIGLPVLMATRALIVYDMAYRSKIELIYGKRRRRTFSELPTAESAARRGGGGGLSAALAGWLPSFMRGWGGGGGGGDRRRSVRAGNNRASAQRMRRSVGRGGGDGDDAASEDDTSSLGSLDSAEISATPEGLHYPRQLEDDPVASLEQYRELQSVVYWVQYWTVLGVALLFEQLPVSGHLLAALPFWPPARVLWALWLQVPGTSGAALSFRLVVPLVDRLLGRVQGPGVSAEQQNLLVNVLFAFRVISSESRAKLGEMLETGGTLLALGLFFFVMPSTITGMGAVAIGIGRPIVAASRALLNIDRAEKLTRAAASPRADAAARKRFRSNSVSISHGAVQTTQWLEYWVVYTVCMLGHGLLSVFLFWFPLWNHMLLVFTLWLQLPYFRGAHNMFKVALAVFYRVRAVFVSGKAKADKAAADRAAGGGAQAEEPRPLSPVEEADEAMAVAEARRASAQRKSAQRQSAQRQSAQRQSAQRQSAQRSSGQRASAQRASAQLAEQAKADRKAARKAERKAERRAQRQQAAAAAAQQQTWLGWVFGGGAAAAVPDQFAADAADDEDGDDDSSAGGSSGSADAAAAQHAQQAVDAQQRRRSREADLGGPASDSDDDAAGAGALEEERKAGDDDDDDDNAADSDYVDEAEADELLRAALLDMAPEDGAESDGVLDRGVRAAARDSVESGGSAARRKRASRGKAKLNRKLMSTGGSSSSLASGARAKAEADEAARAEAAAAAAATATAGGGFFSWFGGK